MTTPWQQRVTPTDLAYLAGLIDGEGVITIERYKPYGNFKNPKYTMKVEVQMSDLPAIEHVAVLYDRPIMVKNMSANMKKVGYRLSWQARIAAALLEEVMPYLIVKLPQARAAVAFQQVASAKRRIGSLLSAEELEARDFYYRELRRLKQLP